MSCELRHKEIGFFYREKDAKRLLKLYGKDWVDDWLIKLDCHCYEPNSKKQEELVHELKVAISEICNGKEPWYDEFDFQGSRGSGKTHPIVEGIIDVFLSKPKSVIYIFRENLGELTAFRDEIFPKLEERGFIVKRGIGGNFNLGENILTNGDNKIVFKHLNAETMKDEKGKGAGLPVWTGLDYILAFLEEANQIEQALARRVLSSLRSSINTKKVIFRASNPWDALNHYIKECEENLPEDLNELEKYGFQKKTWTTKDGIKKFLLRNNIKANPYLDLYERIRLENLKEVDYEAWKIEARGVSGVRGDLIYSNNMLKMREFDIEKIMPDFVFQGGVDWGDGASRGASPTTMNFMSINDISGVDVIRGDTLWNNRPEKSYSANDIIDYVIGFYISCFMEVKKPFKIYVDDAGHTGWYTFFNARLHLQGAGTHQIEFLPAIKLSVEERISLSNYMLSSGLLRINPELKDWINAYKNCYYMPVKNMNETIKKKRSHRHTHWIDAVDYGLGTYIYEFRSRFNTIFSV